MALDGQLAVTVDRNGVAFSFTVENPTTSRVTLSFSSGLIVDFAVLDGEHVVWRWSEGRSIPPKETTEFLAPGESFTVTRTWRSVRPGEYVGLAELQTTNHDLVVRESFTV